MSHLSPAGREGYPGYMLTQVKYTWTDDNQLHINIRATATEPTPANVTNYSLINLAGHVRLIIRFHPKIITYPFVIVNISIRLGCWS